MSIERQASYLISDDFDRAAKPVRSKKRSKRRAPFSLRLTIDERQRIEALAGDQPIGAYIKAKALGSTARTAKRAGGTIEDRQALAKVLALLGNSRIANNLNQLAYAANIGALHIDPEIKADLNAAIDHVAQIRSHLITALGFKPKERL